MAPIGYLNLYVVLYNDLKTCISLQPQNMYRKSSQSHVTLHQGKKCSDPRCSMYGRFTYTTLSFF